ncbi:DNA repair protein [Sulfitobacter sp. F26169L]|uniref:DNA repair protein n=1 Tax=Sulfitobacter sp. F26169L TaxID=2996015 RepID=UPI002260ED6C|nr:DNA repair protein [Sulfitobacter sp. F26169L]MCX7566210.1 DNA repair protein [Sulfitobacter sp. F26169L]
MQQLKAFGFFLQYVMQRLAMLFFAACAAALTTATILATLGYWQWIELPFSYAGEPVENAGMYLQIAATVLAAGICFFLPANARIMQLENSHRRFTMSMDDVARAYGAVHAADRGRTFQLSSEFDAVRERLAYLRDHPDLSTLEPALLEAAAQMSHISRELAEVYSDDKIARARDFLKQRQEEINLFNSRLEQAKSISTEMKHWLHEVELEESVAAAQLARLTEEMNEIMPQLGRETVLPVEGPAAQEDEAPLDSTALDNSVYELPKAAE